MASSSIGRLSVEPHRHDDNQEDDDDVNAAAAPAVAALDLGDGANHSLPGGGSMMGPLW